MGPAESAGLALRVSECVADDGDESEPASVGCGDVGSEPRVDRFWSDGGPEMRCVRPTKGS